MHPSILSRVTKLHTSWPDTGITILDEDGYFAAGLWHFLRKHEALRHYCRDTSNRPNLLFFTFKTFWAIPPDLLQAPSSSVRLICIADLQQTEERTFRLYPWIPIMHRNASLPCIVDIIEKAAQSTPLLGSERRQNGGRLTYKETDVLIKLVKGLSTAKVGKLCGIREKSVSLYKHRAMKKLGFRSFQGLYFWLNGSWEGICHNVIKLPYRG